jgi:energy-coupling factor transport system permease protein
MRAISILITWSLESSIDSADSMQSRGYGLKGRTNYSNYKWKKHDTFTGIIILVLSILTLIYVFNGKIDYNFYPVMNNINISLDYLIFYAVTSLLMLLPTILNLKEMILWRFYQSKI